MIVKRHTHLGQTALLVCYLTTNAILSSRSFAGSWSDAHAMNVARLYHTATLLRDGTVLVAGGWDGSGVTASAEIYNPIDGSWTPTSPMPSARYDHAAALLPDGRVLVAGGSYQGNAALASAEIYNPISKTWSSTEPMTVGRYTYALTTLPNGAVLATGGACDSGCFPTAAELYDAGAGTWGHAGDLSIGRYEHTVSLLPSGLIVIAGGSQHGAATSSVDIYDSMNKTWGQAEPLNIAREGGAATVLSGGMLLITGGSSSDGSETGFTSCEIYNPMLNKWTVTGDLATGRKAHRAVLLPNSAVLVAGGYASGALSSTELFDPATGAWTTNAPMHASRYNFTMTVLQDGRVLVAGGYNNAVLAGAELFGTGLVPDLKIASQPQSQLGYWGKSMTFSVGLTNGTPPYTYQWRKSGVDIPDATNSVLVLTNLQPTDAAAYTASVADAVTNLLSAPAKLTVNPAGVSIALYTGVTIDGVVGQTYGVQTTTDLDAPDAWLGRANVTLTNATQTWYDTRPATLPRTYYRVVPGPIVVPQH